MASLSEYLAKQRWTVSNRTACVLNHTITGVALSPVHKNCIVLYVRIPREVQHLPFPRRDKLLDVLGVPEPDEGYEEDLPVILLNKSYPHISMANINKYAFYRNFARYAKNEHGLWLQDPKSAAKLVGKTLWAKDIQMRKLNTDVRLWSVDRLDLMVK